MQFYSDPARESDTYALPDCEAFQLTQQDFIQSDPASSTGDMLRNACECGSDRFSEAASLAGWYYWYCFPGCMPDSDPFGPYASEALAIADARERD